MSSNASHVRIVRLLFTLARPSSASTAIEDDMRLMLRNLSQDFATVRAGTLSSEDILTDSAHGRAIGTVRGCFDAFVECLAPLSESFSNMIKAIGPSIRLIESTLDLRRSAIIAGTRNLIADGRGSHMVIFALRASTSHADFIDHWHKHAALVEQLGNLAGSYYQIHGDLDMSRDLSHRAGIGIADFDGHAGSFLDDLAALRAGFLTPGYEAALADEGEFIDHSSSFFGVYKLID